jgi:hypothetical protein
VSPSLCLRPDLWNLFLFLVLCLPFLRCSLSKDGQRLSSCSFLACLTLLSAGSVQRKYLSHIPQPPCPALLPQQEWTTSQQLLFPCVFVLPWIWTWSMASSVHPSKSNMQSISPSAQGLLYGTCDMSKRLGQQGQQLRSYQKVGW